MIFHTNITSFGEKITHYPQIFGTETISFTDHSCGRLGAVSAKMHGSFARREKQREGTSMLSSEDIDLFQTLEKIEYDIFRKMLE